ncbi:MAG: 6,7-dimethyl-8-ribityllumazine synthase [Rickettsiales bacterium]|nr:6,7-dimethyl-8-ribityllumazine synthase [Rickettsiales bacterium]|tara:strand:- start:1494 stop:1898 length:405 start_codon:yes stop_codon:yes gene_type:complete
MKKILIIVSTFYSRISEKLLNGSTKLLEKNKIKYDIKKVYGSLEIPFILEKYKNKYDGYIILACIIQGETDHYKVVREISVKHIYEIAYKNKLALGSAVLTVKNFEQALERADIKKRNLGGKAAEVCLDLMKEI